MKMKSMFTAVHGTTSWNSVLYHVRRSPEEADKYAEDCNLPADEIRRLAADESGTTKRYYSMWYERDHPEPPPENVRPVYKFTDKNLVTRMGYQWKLGQWNHIRGGRFPVCSDRWFHAYCDPIVGAVLRPAHVNYEGGHRFFRGEAVVGVDDHEKLGCSSIRLVEEIEEPVVSQYDRTRFALLAAEAVGARDFSGWDETVAQIEWNPDGIVLGIRRLEKICKANRTPRNAFLEWYVTGICCWSENDVRLSVVADRIASFAQDHNIDLAAVAAAYLKGDRFR